MVEEFLSQKGEQVRWRVVEEVHEGGAAMLSEIERALAELSAALMETDDDEEADRLTAKIAALRRVRRHARAETPTVSDRWEGTDRTFAEDWYAAENVEERRAVLDDALTSVTVFRGGLAGAPASNSGRG